MSAINVGVVGCGRSAYFRHLPALLKMPEKFRVMALCDTEKSHRDAWETKVPGIMHYRRPEDMYDNPDLEMVLIATPSKGHEEMALDVLRRKLWAVCEMPVSLTPEGTAVLRGTSNKEGKRLIPAVTGMFSPEFRLAQAARGRKRLGKVYDIRITDRQFLRRDDWQVLSRCGGGAAFYALQEPMLQAMWLLKSPIMQLWADMKQLVSLGDVEDYTHVLLKAGDLTTAEIETNNAELGEPGPRITIRGTKGVFTVMKGERVGTVTYLEQSDEMGRKRSGVALPMLEELKPDNVKIGKDKITLPDELNECDMFWNAVYDCARNRKPFPITLETLVDMARYVSAVRKSSPI